MRIYIATRLTNPNPARFLMNCGVAIRAGISVMLKGHSPFIPPLDILVPMNMHEDELLSLGNLYYYKQSLDWLSVCDAIWIVNGIEDSKGVQAEFNFAKKKGIRIYTSLEEIPTAKQEADYQEFKKLSNAAKKRIAKRRAK
jgi:hypothetical protein